MLFTGHCLAGPIYDRDIVGTDQREFYRNALEFVVENGSADGQLLYWDNTNLVWKASDETKLKWDAGTDTLTATNITTSSITTAITNTQVVYSNSGLLSGDSDMTFAVDTLTVTKIGAFELTGKLSAGASEIQGMNFDINGGTIDGVTINNSPISGSTGSFTSIVTTGGGSAIQLEFSGGNSSITFLASGGVNHGDLTFIDETNFDLDFPLEVTGNITSTATLIGGALDVSGNGDIDGRLSLGSLASDLSTAQFNLQHEHSIAGNMSAGFLSLRPTGVNNTTNVRGFFGNIDYRRTGGTITNLEAVKGQGNFTNTGSGTVTNYRNFFADNVMDTSFTGTVDTYVNFDGDAITNNSGTNTITTAIGYRQGAISADGTLNIGLDIGSITAATTNYAIRTGTGLVFLGDATTIAGDLIVDTDTLVVDAAANRVGIGVNTPTYKLDVISGTDNIVANFESTDAEAFITFHDNTTVTNRTAIGAVGTRMSIFAGGSERISILTGGNVGIGTSSPDTKLQVVGDCKFGDDNTNYTAFSTTGVQTMAGTARVMISIDLEPVLATRPVANPPGEGTEDSFSTHDFNATTDESVFFHLELAHDYAAAGLIHVHFDFFVDTAPASAESVVWGVEYKEQSIGDNFDFGAGTTTAYTQTSVTTGTPANDKKVHESSEISLTTTGFAAGDYILLRLFRDADGTGGTDDYTGDARVIDYHIEYLSDKLGEAT